MISSRDRLDNGKVAAYFTDFLLQQEMRLIIEIARTVQYAFLDSTIDIAALRK